MSDPSHSTPGVAIAAPPTAAVDVERSVVDAEADPRSDGCVAVTS